jgi:hypothetical protein
VEPPTSFSPKKPIRRQIHQFLQSPNRKARTAQPFPQGAKKGASAATSKTCQNQVRCPLASRRLGLRLDHNKRNSCVSCKHTASGGSGGALPWGSPSTCHSLRSSLKGTSRRPTSVQPGERGECSQALRGIGNSTCLVRAHRVVKCVSNMRVSSNFYTSSHHIVQSYWFYLFRQACSRTATKSRHE